MQGSIALLILLTLNAAHAEGLPSVLAHPPFDASYRCSEHFDGQLDALGDALGTDCTVSRLTTIDDQTWMRDYAHEGRRNEDWFGWREPVLSPCDCKVIQLQLNPKVNTPGLPGKPPASYIILERDDGTFFAIAHIRESIVNIGDTVQAGQAIARVGNNGYARAPHIHIGAWHGDTPMQIRFDQTRMQLPPEFRNATKR